MEEAIKILQEILVVITGDLKVPIGITGMKGTDLIVITGALKIVAGAIMNACTGTGDTVVFDLIKRIDDSHKSFKCPGIPGAFISA